VLYFEVISRHLPGGEVVPVQVMKTRGAEV
jgi:hypothetical protein